uniref:Uncharacterized protein n=1 Tax=Pyxicephalus adspersus TaxID=30357 RepID=A0AAV3ABT6_PYXAD|nr:TPA: hypothetical protein GDO54_018256 [Pyxicephalus adspersus]
MVAPHDVHTREPLTANHPHMGRFGLKKGHLDSHMVQSNSMAAGYFSPSKLTISDRSRGTIHLPLHQKKSQARSGDTRPKKILE